MREAAELHRNCWEGLHAFESLQAKGIIQTPTAAIDANARRLAKTLATAYSSAFDQIYIEEWTSDVLFPLIWKATPRTPQSIEELEYPRHLRLMPRVMHEYLLVTAAAGIKAPLLHRLWQFYPRYGIPCGLRKDGTILLFVCPPGFLF